MPTPEALGFEELGLEAVTGRTLLAVETEEWLAEARERAEYLAGFVEKLPESLAAENDALIQRLELSDQE